jgi:hypothetical protein
VLINIEEKKEDRNIELNKTSDENFDSFTMATSQGFYQHPSLVQNNFIIKNDKIQNKENIKENKQENKEISLNFIGINTAQNFHKKQISQILDDKTFQINVESPLTLSSHRHNPSNFSSDSNRIFLKQNKENSPDRDPKKNHKRSISHNINTKNSQSELKSNLLIDTIIEIPHVALTEDDLRQFLFSPIPEGRILTCNVKRKKLSVIKEKDFYIYYVFLSDNDRFVMASYFNKNKNCYSITRNIEVLEDKQEDNIGCVYSNYFGTEFNIFDQGKKPSKTVSIEEARVNLGTVRFEVSFFGLKNPRKVSLYLPKVDRNTIKVVESQDSFVNKTYITYFITKYLTYFYIEM